MLHGSNDTYSVQAGSMRDKATRAKYSEWMLRTVKEQKVTGIWYTQPHED